ncbi:MAG TPA: hypothetical protein VKD72_37520 [Gemmataceae bacterium]|nr:hypothetical protein [Gemmataceae bacterium]
MSAPPPNQEERGDVHRAMFAALICPLLFALLLLVTFIEPKGPSMLADLWWAFHAQPSWVVWLTRVILAGLVVHQFQFVSRPMLRELWRSSRETPDAAPAAPLEREPVTELWVGILVFPVFGGMIASVPLAGSDPEGGAWGTFLAVLLVGGFCTLMALVLGVPRLEELRRRGAWAPPGTDRRPVLAAGALALLIMTAAGAFMFAGVRLLEFLGLAR